MRSAPATECISTFDAWEALRPEWQALWRRIDQATPFQLPEWQLNWWRHLGGGELVVATARREEVLVGLAPFFRYQEGHQSRLLPVGIGVTDRLDPLLDPEDAKASAAALLRCLTAEAKPGERIEFHELATGSPLLQLRAPPGWRSECAIESICPTLALPNDIEHLSRSLPRKTLRDLQQARRRCDNAGGIAIEIADCGSCRALLGALIELHAKRWHEREEPGVLADAAVQGFHRAVVRAMAEKATLRLYALRLDSRIVAAFYGLAGSSCLYAYLTGFDPACARLSVGAVLLGHVVEAAIGEGVVELDMLRGEENYKYAWGGVDRPNYRLSFVPVRT